MPFDLETRQNHRNVICLKGWLLERKLSFKSNLDSQAINCKKWYLLFVVPSFTLKLHFGATYRNENIDTKGNSYFIFVFKSFYLFGLFISNGWVYGRSTFLRFLKPLYLKQKESLKIVFDWKTMKIRRVKKQQFKTKKIYFEKCTKNNVIFPI